MRLRRKIYLIIGTIFIVINLLVDLIELPKLYNDSADTANKFGYFIGLHALLIFGLIFMRMASKLKQKINKIEEADRLTKAIDSIGKDSL